MFVNNITSISQKATDSQQMLTRGFAEVKIDIFFGELRLSLSLGNF